MPKYSEQTLQSKLIKQQLKKNTLFYCLVQKQSNSGLIYNQRVLIIELPEYHIYYSKDIPDRPYSQIKAHPKGKEIFKMSDIKIRYQSGVHVELEERNAELKRKRLWKFQFYAKQLAKKWVDWALHLQQKVINVTNKSTCQTNSLSAVESQLSQKIYYSAAIDFSKGFTQTQQSEVKKSAIKIKVQKINQ